MAIETVPYGYRPKKVRVTVKAIEYSPTKGIEFLIFDSPHDAYAHDHIASFIKWDIEDQIKVFRKAKYTDAEIQRVFDEMHAAYDPRRGYSSKVMLPRPITHTITVLESSWGGGKRRHSRATKDPARVARKLAATMRKLRKLTGVR